MSWVLHVGSFLKALVCCVLQQYWSGNSKHKYIPVAAFADAFQKTNIAKESRQYLEQPYKAPNKKCEEALITHHYALSCKCSDSDCILALSAHRWAA